MKVIIIIIVNAFVSWLENADIQPLADAEWSEYSYSRTSKGLRKKRIIKEKKGLTVSFLLWIDLFRVRRRLGELKFRAICTRAVNGFKTEQTVSQSHTLKLSHSHTLTLSHSYTLPTGLGK